MRIAAPNTYEKPSVRFFYKLLFFLSFIVLILLSEGSSFVNGGYKYFDNFARVIIPIAIVFYFSFFRSLVAFYINAVSRVIKIITLIGAIPIGILITIRFFRAFFENVLSGGDSPVMVKKLFSLMHASTEAASAISYLSCVILCLLSIGAIAVLLGLLLHVIIISLQYTKNNPNNEWVPSKQKQSSRYIIAIVLSILSGVLCFTKLTKGLDWGADYAVYIQQGIQLAKGITSGIHEAWGLSAMLSVIYLIFGFNTVDYHTIIYYKLPSAICFTIMVFFLYLFFSKRFQLFWSIFLTSLIGFNPVLIDLNNATWTDFPHMLFCVISIILIYELFYRSRRREQIVFGVLAGAFICVANLIRAAGIALLITLFLTQLVYLIVRMAGRNKPSIRSIEMPQKSNVYIQLLPYIVYFLLTWIASQVVPYYSTGDSAGRYASAGVFFRNFDYYYQILFSEFLSSLIPYRMLLSMVAWAAVPCFLIGVYRSAAKDTVSVIYFCFMFISMLFVWALNGIRYAFPLLPFFVLFLAVGAKTVIKAVSEKYDMKKSLSRVVTFGAACFMIFLLSSSAINSYSNIANEREMDRFAFSTDAIATYNYIQNETSADAEIVFYKYPVVALTTGRVATSVISKDQGIDQYLLITMDPSHEHQYIPDEYASVQALEDKLGIQLQLVYENARFQLFQIII